MANKYNARRTYSALCDRFFSSRAECRRGEELCLLEKVGEISGLQYQVKYVLSKEPKVSITIDFVYYENGELIREDSKGILTRDFRTKLAWLGRDFNIKVKLSG